MSVKASDLRELMALTKDLEITITDQWQMMKIRQIKSKIIEIVNYHNESARKANDNDWLESAAKSANREYEYK